MQFDATRFDIKDQAYENILEEYVGPADRWKEIRDFQLKLLERLQLHPAQKFLDVGCGTLRAGLPLVDYLESGRYCGVDIDPEAIAIAHQLVERFDLASKAPTIRQSNDFGLTEFSPSTFDFIWYYQVMIHLTEPLVKIALESISTLLKPECRAYFTVRELKNGQDFAITGAWRHYPVSNVSKAFLKREAEALGLALCYKGNLSDFDPPENIPGGECLLVEAIKI